MGGVHHRPVPADGSLGMSGLHSLVRAAVSPAPDLSGNKFRWTHPFGQSTSRSEQLAIAISVAAMGTLGFSITAPILPDLADALGVSRASIGLVQAAISVPGVILSVMIGYLADRLGRRRVILASLLLFATFGAAGFLARAYWGLVAVRFVQGIGTSGILGVGVVLVGDLFEGPSRARAMGFNLAGVTTVNMLGPVASGLLGAGGVFRPFLIFLIGFPLALWASRLPSDSSREVESPVRHGKAAVAMLRRDRYLADYAGLLVATIGTTVLLHGFGYTTTPLYLDSIFGVPSSGRGFIIASFQVGTVLAAVQIGRLRVRSGGSRLIGSAFVLMSIGSAVAALAPGWWAVSLGLGTSGLGFGLFVPLAQEKAASIGGPLYRGITVLTWVTAVRIAQVVGPPMASSLSESIGPRPTFTIASLAMLVAALSWRRIRALAGRAVVS
jgi:ACDE family multidrug resistance protein